MNIVEVEDWKILCGPPIYNKTQNPRLLRSTSDGQDMISARQLTVTNGGGAGGFGIESINDEEYAGLGEA